MTVGELLELLEDFPEDAEVRLAHQPSWPFEYSIETVADSAGEQTSCSECGIDWDEHDEEGCDEKRPELPDLIDEPPVVYIAEGEQIGYLPGSAARALGWK
jgi:hypothetical protein